MRAWWSIPLWSALSVAAAVLALFSVCWLLAVIPRTQSEGYRTWRAPQAPKCRKRETARVATANTRVLLPDPVVIWHRRPPAITSPSVNKQTNNSSNNASHIKLISTLKSRRRNCYFAWNFSTPSHGSFSIWNAALFNAISCGDCIEKPPRNVHPIKRTFCLSTQYPVGIESSLEESMTIKYFWKFLISSLVSFAVQKVLSRIIYKILKIRYFRNIGL